jgi:CDP-glycerol glycerophosphotransferase (TagB/SpsB family)
VNKYGPIFMKTILIPIFDGMVARNLLYTGVLKHLTDTGARVVLLPQKSKIEYYKERFKDNPDVIVETEPIWKHSRSEFIMAGLFRHSIPTHAMKVRQVYWYWNEGKYIQYFATAILRNLGYFYPWHLFIRWIDSFIKIPGHIEAVFKKYNPDVVFAPTMVAQDEVFFMRLAKKYGKISVGMMKSWDNPSTKAFLRVFPDFIIVHNELIKKETAKLFHYPLQKITVTGIPQYDMYADKSLLSTREEFLRKIGGDPSKKLILFAPAGDWMSMYDKDVLEDLLDAVNAGEFGAVQVLLRLHPAYESKTEELKGRPNLIVERGGKHLSTSGQKDSDLKAMEFDVEEIKHLMNSLYHADVTVNSASTMCIEAACFDRPIILISYDGHTHLPYWRSIARNYERDFYVPLVTSGGATLVSSKAEFIDAVKKYLENPHADSAGRARMREEQTYKLDGKSSERLADFLLSVKK